MSPPPGHPKEEARGPSPRDRVEDEGLQMSPLGGTARSVQGASTGIPIQVRRCGKTFDDGTRALEPIDLEIAAGETGVCSGPRGAVRPLRCASLPVWSHLIPGAKCCSMASM